jgi:hypothetical protein
VVIGGYGPPKPNYTRVLRRQGKWKLMIGPEDARTVFGLTAAEAQTLKELDTWAAGQAANAPKPQAAIPVPPPETATPPPPQAPAAVQPEPIPTISAAGDPTPQAVAGSSGPTTSPSDASLQPAAKLLVAAIADVRENDRLLIGRRAIRSLLQAGFVDEASEVLSLLPRSDRGPTIGQIAAYTDPDASQASLDRVSRENSSAFWTGYAQACAWRGDAAGVWKALTAQRGTSLERMLLAATLDAGGGLEVLDRAEAVALETGVELNLIRSIGAAAVSLGVPERATALLEKLNRKPPPARSNADAWGKRLREAGEECQGAMAIASAGKGDFAAAKAPNLPRQYRIEVLKQMAVVQARQGDLQGLTKTLDEEEFARSSRALLCYVHALKGDMQAAERAMTSPRSPVLAPRGSEYGWIAHARRKSGDSTAADKAIADAISFATGIPKANDKAEFLLRLIDGSNNGPTYSASLTD